ncbi:MAG: ELWxxDGT repeat protein [Candidatus Sumerlaeia bacterium]
MSRQIFSVILLVAFVVGARASTPILFTPAGSITNQPAFISSDGTVYFYKYANTQGYEIWRSDATPAGTALIHINNGGFWVKGFGELDHYVYFCGYDTAHGYELWRTDGTAAGTAMVRDINPGSSSSSPKQYYRFGPNLYFAAKGASGTFPWLTDGTTSGTRLLTTSAPGGYFYGWQGTLLIEQYAGGSFHLYASDGVTSDSTYLLDSAFDQIVAVGDTLYTIYDKNQFDAMIPWMTTIHNIVMDKITPGSAAGCKHLGTLAENTYYTGYIDRTTVIGAATYQNQIWLAMKQEYDRDTSDDIRSVTSWVQASDGSTVGSVFDAGGSDLLNLTNYDGKLFYAGRDGRVTWVDANLTTHTLSQHACGQIVAFGDKLCFVGDSRLWLSDGTQAGTTAVTFMDNSLEVAGSWAWRDLLLLDVRSPKYRLAGNIFYNHYLWVTDGTAGGTRLLTVDGYEEPFSFWSDAHRVYVYTGSNSCHFWVLKSAGNSARRGWVLYH